MTCEKRRRNVSQNLENWDDKISQIEWQKYSCSNSYLFFFFRLSSANFFDWTALKAVEPIQHEPLTRSFLPQKLGFLICLGKISYLSCGSFKYISSQLLKDFLLIIRSSSWLILNEKLHIFFWLQWPSAQPAQENIWFFNFVMSLFTLIVTMWHQPQFIFFWMMMIWSCSDCEHGFSCGAAT